ncbi:MAG: LamG domain-containing protein, partial [Candidatus Krumholzibacteria bacterium]|nr:LamG domain-containing protein [Candidatus Krumholzibacteria bacterium]
RYFDGIDDYITIPDNNLLDMREEITLSMWVYINNPDAMTTTPLSSLICKGSESGPVNYQLLIENLSATDGYSTVYFRYGNSGQHAYRADIPNRLSTGWFHLVFSCRFGDPSSAVFSAGYDCENMETLNGAWIEGNGGEGASITEGNLLIGRDMTMDRFFPGYLDEIIISDKIWTLPVIKFYNLCYK